MKYSILCIDNTKQSTIKKLIDKEYIKIGKKNYNIQNKLNPTIKYSNINFKIIQNNTTIKGQIITDNKKAIINFYDNIYSSKILQTIEKAILILKDNLFKINSITIKNNQIINIFSLNSFIDNVNIKELNKELNKHYVYINDRSKYYSELELKSKCIYDNNKETYIKL